MTVTIRDTRYHWHPVLITLTIPDHCTKCGGPRGTTNRTRQCLDGEFYYVDTWTNPCGHIEKYHDLIADFTVAR